MLDIRQLASRSFALLSYIITDTVSSECLIIDPSAEIGSHTDISSPKIKAVINTHTHPDHTMGNRLFAGKTPILAHRDEGSLLRKFTIASLTAVFTARIPPKISFTLAEGQDIVLGSTSIKVLHTPGHSPGSICLYWEGNVITGDTIFVEGIGRTDLPGGSTRAVKQSIERILTLPGKTRIWPGHYYGGKYTATLGEVGPFLKQVMASL